MTLQIWFWLFYVLALVFGLWRDYPGTGAYPWRYGAGTFLLFVLIGILGWATFGSPVK
jgi:hypothetical protein